MNIQALLGLQGQLAQFKDNHPKFTATGREALSKGFFEGQEIAIAIRYPDGTELKSGIRVRQSDLPLLEAVKEIIK